MKTAKNATKTSKTSHANNHETTNTETTMKTQTKKKTSTTTPASPIALAPSAAAPPTTASGSVAAVIAAVYPTTPPGDMPPTTGVPATPKDWTGRPSKGKGRRGAKLTKDQVTSAAAAAGEITKSATYVTDFGPHAPSQAALGFLMSNSTRWRVEWEHASQYLTYAAEQRAAWDQAMLAQMDTLKQTFDFVASREPAVTEKYSATEKFLDARSAVGQRAANTRKEKLQAKAKGAGAVPATQEPAPAASAPVDAAPVVAK